MDWLGDLIGAALFGDKELSKRGENIVRLLFGLVLTGLSVAGAIWTVGYEAGLHFRIVGVLLFLGLASFGFFNVCLRRQWRWPGCSVLVFLALLFVVRILFGP